MRRRTFAGILGSIAAGTAGYGVLTQESQAVSVDMNTLDVADKDFATSQPVNGATLNVGVDWQYETATTPTRVTLRLNATYAGESYQLGAAEVPGALSPNQSGEHDFSSNLLDHPEITAVALTPQDVGESKSLTFDVSVTMTVYGESGELGGETIQDTTTITVDRKAASVETSLSAEGTISISTKTPA